MKRILTIQDISCVGKCSLTVALPTISACGVETVILPTAVLSNHTQFESWTFRDLTDDLPGITQKWQEENITFDCIYTGYLGSERQIGIVSQIIEKFRTEDNFVIVDPAMADDGKLYPGFDMAFAAAMANLCKNADYIVPNLTEASLILGIPYVGEGYDEKYIQDLLQRLTVFGANTAVITGVSFDKGHIGAYGYNRARNYYFSYMREKLPVSFHGTGDLYASAFCGAMAQRKGEEQSTRIAVDYTVECIQKTMENPNHNFYGVEFERALPYLIKKLTE